MIGWIFLCFFFVKILQCSIAHFEILTNQVAVCQETKLLPKMEQLSIDCHGLVEDNFKILEASFILIPYQGYKKAVQYNRFFLLRKDSDIHVWYHPQRLGERAEKFRVKFKILSKTSHESPCSTEVGKRVDPRCFWSRRSQRSHELNSIDGIGKLIEVNLQKFHIVGNPFTWIIPRTTFVCWFWTLARYLAFEYYINTFGQLMVVCFSFSQMSCNAVPKTAWIFRVSSPAFEAPSCLSALHSALQALVTENEADIEGAKPQPFWSGDLFFFCDDVVRTFSLKYIVLIHNDIIAATIMNVIYIMHDQKSSIEFELPCCCLFWVEAASRNRLGHQAPTSYPQTESNRGKPASHDPLPFEWTSTNASHVCLWRLGRISKMLIYCLIDIWIVMWQCDTMCMCVDHLLTILDLIHWLRYILDVSCWMFV